VRSSRLALPGVLTAAHQLVELSAGSGIIGQRHVGLGPAVALSLLADGACVVLAHQRRRWDRTLAIAAGTALAAPALHYTLFPWRWRGGVPVLVEAEGLRGPAVTGYVALLYAWAAAGAVAVAAVPRGRRRWSLAGVAAAVAFRQVAADHLVWIGHEARRRPRWWNRAWQAHS
jgi:hypothetical protein